MRRATAVLSAGADPDMIVACRKKAKTLHPRGRKAEPLMGPAQCRAPPI
jgi:hypothetical protein